MILESIPPQRLPYSFVGPSSVPTRQHINNAITTSYMGMPFKPDTMTQGSDFSRARKVYNRDAGGGQGWFTSSQHIDLKKINAIGKSSINTRSVMSSGIINNKMSFRSQERNSRNSALTRVRGGGSVAPKKKGAIANTFKSG